MRTATAIVFSSILLGAGCSVEQMDGLAERRVRLTPERPARRERPWDVQLLRVEADGAAVVTQGGATRTLKAGQPASDGVALPWLVRSDPQSQTAVLATLWTQTLTTYRLGPFACRVLETNE